MQQDNPQMKITCLDFEGVLIPEIWIGLSEETGIEEIRIIPSWTERTEYSYSRKGSVNRKQVYWYLATTDEFQVKLSHEHTNFLWLDLESAIDQLTFEQEKIVLSNARKVLEKSRID